MDIGTISLLIIVVMIGLMLTGMPLAWVTMLLAVGCTLLWLGPMGLPLVASRVYGFVSEYVFVAVPLFVLMACVLEGSGVARDLYRAMHVFAGTLPGGLAVQTVLVAMIMAAMTGIIGGEIVLLGLIALPQMLSRGYDSELAIAETRPSTESWKQGDRTFHCYLGVEGRRLTGDARATRW